MRLIVAAALVSGLVGFVHRAQAEAPPPNNTGGAAPPEQSPDAKPPDQPPATPPEKPPASGSAKPTQTDEELLREIEAKTAPSATVSPTAGTATTPDQKPGQAAAVGLSNIYNPAMSVNGLFLGTFSSDKNPPPERAQSGLAAQEIELQLIANVDPYFSANVLLSLPSGESLGLEEGYVVPTATPFGLQARIGQMRVPFGRENALHTHALPFVDCSLANVAVFAPDGLDDVGAELTYLLPLPWYGLLNASLYNGNNVASFGSPRQRDFMGFFGSKNVFDLTDDATLEASASFALGDNADTRVNWVAGGDLVFKWRPAKEAQTKGLVIVAEALYSRHPNAAALLPPVAPGQSDGVGGGYAYAQWKLEQRWFVAARGDYLGFPSDDRGVTRRGSAILVFAPTEFSAVRLQGSAVLPPHGVATVYEAFLQLNFTLGAHPAHGY